MKWMLWDYGVGNLHSLQKALQAIELDVHVTSDPESFLAADVCVLPGVGAFGHVMESLAPIAEGLRARHDAGKPILGVCIGMQVLFEGSDESTLPGLGILHGHVSKLEAPIIPHMGWNEVKGPWNEVVYYVHSYAAPSDGAIATSQYGKPFAAAVQEKCTIGFQFHPEKSSAAGRAILKWAAEQFQTNQVPQ